MSFKHFFRLSIFTLSLFLQAYLLYNAIQGDQKPFILMLVFWIMSAILTFFCAQTRKFTALSLAVSAAFPIYSVLSLCLWGHRKFYKLDSKLLNRTFLKSEDHLKHDQKLIDQLKPSLEKQICELFAMNSPFPAYKSTRISHVQTGAAFFNLLFDEMSKAKKTIFIDMYHVETGNILSQIMKILETKAQEGVVVRIILDAHGSRNFFMSAKISEYAEKNIFISTFSDGCATKNPLFAYKNARNFIIIDGNNAFLDALDFTDESHEKSVDSLEIEYRSIILRGQGVSSFVVTFCALWDHLNKTTSDVSAFKPTIGYLEESALVQPFWDEGADFSGISKIALLKIIYSAGSYIFIQTNSLKFDQNILEALEYASRGGVDVRISIGNIKKIKQNVLELFYFSLICVKLKASGVHIIESAKTDMKSNTMSCDDKISIFGAIHNEEQSEFFYKNSAALTTKTIVMDDQTALFLKEAFINHNEI